MEETISHDTDQQGNSSRREFLKKSLLTTAYIAPLVLSFTAKDLHAQKTQVSGSGSGGHDDDDDDD